MRVTLRIVSKDKILRFIITFMIIIIIKCSSLNAFLHVISSFHLSTAQCPVWNASHSMGCPG